MYSHMNCKERLVQLKRDEKELLGMLKIIQDEIKEIEILNETIDK
jgi:hypothetical protein